MSEKGNQKSDSPTCSDNDEGGQWNYDDDRIIDVPAPNDVLCGKDRNFNKHHGNQIFREVVDEYLDLYESATGKLERKKINKIVIESLRSKYNTRFLRPYGNSGKWQQISEQLARDKLSHAFRFQQKWQRKVSSSRRKRQTSPSPISTSKSTAAASVSSSAAPGCFIKKDSPAAANTKQSASFSLDNKRAVSDAKSIPIGRRRSSAVVSQGWRTRTANTTTQRAASVQLGGVDVQPASDAVVPRQVYLSKCDQQQQQQQQQEAGSSVDRDIKTTEKAKVATMPSFSISNNNTQPDALLLHPIKSFSFSLPSSPRTNVPAIALTTSTSAPLINRKLKRAHSIVLSAGSWSSLSSLQNNNSDYSVVRDANSRTVSSSNDRCRSRATIAAANALLAFDAKTFIGQDHPKQKKDNDIGSSGDGDDRILAGAAIEKDTTVVAPVNKASVDFDQQKRAFVLQAAAVAEASNAFDAFDDSDTSVEQNGGTTKGDEVQHGLDCGQLKDDGSDLEPLDFNDFGFEECNYPHAYHHPTLLSPPHHDYHTTSSANNRGDVQLMDAYIGRMQERQPLANQLSHKYTQSLGCGGKQPPNHSAASLPPSFCNYGDVNAFPGWEQINFLSHQEPAVSTCQHNGLQHPIHTGESNGESNGDSTDIASSYNVMGRWHKNNQLDANTPSTTDGVVSNEQNTNFDVATWASNGQFLERTDEELDALIMQGAHLQQQQQQQHQRRKQN